MKRDKDNIKAFASVFPHLLFLFSFSLSIPVFFIMSNVTLKAACYGKDKVRVLKVYRDQKKQTAVELTCRLTLEGDIETSFTKADNSVVVTTGMNRHHTFVTPH